MTTEMESQPNDDTDTEEHGSFPRDLLLLCCGQAFWMVGLLLVLISLNQWSRQQYFIGSFLGFMIIRLLFAPAERKQHWWNATSMVAWLCFAIFVLLIYLRIS